VQEDFSATSGGLNSAARLVRITRLCADGLSGQWQASLYQVITGGDHDEILRQDGKESITPFDVIPFAATTPCRSRIVSSAARSPIS